MNLEDAWQKALDHTKVIRSRAKSLETFEATALPYIFLGDSSLHAGDVVVRKGEVTVERPSLALPGNSPFFQGFEFEENLPAGASLLDSFFLIRGIRFPSYKYSHKAESLDVFESGMENAVRKYRDELQHREDVRTGLVTGPEDCWQFSVVILIASLMARQAEGDFRRMFERFLKDGS